MDIKIECIDWRKDSFVSGNFEISFGLGNNAVGYFRTDIEGLIYIKDKIDSAISDFKKKSTESDVQVIYDFSK